MINVAIAGVGFMGWIHWLAYRAVDDARVTAICTRDEKKLAGDWSNIQGNFGPPGEQVDLSNIQTYQQMDQVLADDTVDLVDICLPPHLHADAAIQALESGKHVFCEKPMSLTASDCQRMVAAARSAGKQLLIGHVLPYFPEYAKARELIDDNRYGPLLGGSFKRVISDPLWLKDFFDPQRVGGPLVDLHVHDAHLIRMLFGMPAAVTSQGRMRGEVVEFCHTLFDFADPQLNVAATCGVINQQGRAFTHGFEIHLEKATLQYEFAVVDGNAENLMPLTVYDSEGKVIRPELGDGDPIRAFETEIAEVVRSVESNQISPILSGDLAHDAIVMCHQQTQSVRAREKVQL